MSQVQRYAELDFKLFRLNRCADGLRPVNWRAGFFGCCRLVVLALLVVVACNDTTAKAQTLRETDIRELAGGIVGEQSPLFLFSGLDVVETDYILAGQSAYISFNGLTIPDGPQLSDQIFVYLSARDGNLIEIPSFQLPRVWENDVGVSLEMTGPSGEGPVFTGVWHRGHGGFQSFDLDLGSVSYVGEGIKYQVPQLRFELKSDESQSSLGFYVERWEADYDGSLDGSEIAGGLRFQLLAPSSTVNPSQLLTLANRIMASLLDIERPITTGEFQGPRALGLDGLRLEIALESAGWQTRSPPATGSIAGASLTMAIDQQESGLAALSFQLGLDAFDVALADNRVSSKDAFAISFSAKGLDAHVLAGLIYGLSEPSRDGAATAGTFSDDNSLIHEGVNLSLAAQARNVAMAVPTMSVDGTLGVVGGVLSLEDAEGSADSANLRLVVGVEDVTLSNFVGRESLEPLASAIILPLMPQEARLDVTITGLQQRVLSEIAQALLTMNLTKLQTALPRDLTTLGLVIQNTGIVSDLLSVKMDGDFSFGHGGRLPVRGVLDLRTGSLLPLLAASQQAVATPVPELVSLLSAAIVITTVLQGYAVPTEDGQFGIRLDFDGGLPKINGRELPRIPGL